MRIKYTASLASAFFNVWLFGGNPNETISARCYRQGVIEGDVKWNARRRLVNKLFSYWEADHCYRAHLDDRRWSEELLYLHRTSQKSTV